MVEIQKVPGVHDDDSPGDDDFNAPVVSHKAYKTCWRSVSELASRHEKHAWSYKMAQPHKQDMLR